MSFFDEMGDRIKAAEQEYKQKVPAQSYLVLRLDGKAFHTFTKSLEKPYDLRLMSAMDATAVRLCEAIPGAKAAYTQSDEITVLATDWAFSGDGQGGFNVKEQQHWYGGSTQKIISISAALATAHFNIEIMKAAGDSVDPRTLPALFDSRVMAFAGDEEGRKSALEAFRWRQMDCVKNSVSMAAHSVFGHKPLLGVNTGEKIAMLAAEGKAWEDLPAGFRQGRFVTEEKKTKMSTFVDGRDGVERSKLVDRFSFVSKDANEDVFFDALEDVVSAPVRPRAQVSG